MKNSKGLIKEGFIQIKKEIKIKGKKDSSILSFDNFYLQVDEK